MNDAGKAKALFLAAIERDPSGACPTSLDESCGGDAWVRTRVEKLPEAHRIQGALPSSNASARAEMPRLLEGHGTVIGPYTLIEPIGEGGMGVDYLAEQTVPVGRKVALKIIKPGMDTNQVIARFEAERQALAMMAHPHIASVLDAGTTVRGRPYFGMELVRVIPITEYCDNKQLDIPARLRIFVRTCHAVQHAQQKGILHRDLKPSNILVTVLDDAPVPKIIDFGVAKAISGRLTELTLHTGCHQLVGPPLYMSPEQADLSVTDIDTRSDIYSLGVLLYELLTGTTPIPLDTIRHSSHDEIRRLIRDVEPPRPSSRLGAAGDRLAIISTARKALPRPFRRSIRGELGWSVMKAMEKERGRRYQTVGDLAADVVRHLKGEPLEVGPASRRYRFKQFARRNKAILTTTVLVAMALIGGTAISIW